VSTRAVSVLAVLAGLVLGAAVGAFGRLAGFALPWAVTLTGGLAAGVLTAAALRLPAADPDPVPPARPSAPPVTAAFGDLGTLRFTVEHGNRDLDRFETGLRPRLVDLAIELLWQRHRLDWRVDADRSAAQELLGPQLTELLTAAPRTLPLTPHTLTRWTRDLEDL
jgi:hypothetical protein